MGGEALKALHIMQGLQKLGVDVVQLTHARVRDELTALNTGIPVHFIEDDWLQLILHRLRLSWLLGAYGSWLLHRKARALVSELSLDLIHFTSPISPTLPYFRIRGCPVVIGPLNGNILHPPQLLHREKLPKSLGALALMPYQKIAGALFRGKLHATLLVSGGERTVRALKLSGCRDDQVIMTLDSGVDDAMAQMPRLTHSGINRDFIFVGRLIEYKACDLAIRALVQAPSARLHVVGDGDERPKLERLVARLGIVDRVIFHGWVEPGEELNRLFRHGRAFIFPTLAEANGIVVQEAMMLGLPVVAVDWGGPQMLLDKDTGILIEPKCEDHIVQQFANAMEYLAVDAAAADRLSATARSKAGSLGFAWHEILNQWLLIYRALTV
jgi:glycosyltransferase involved in cell wall biosynthesis